MDGNEKGTTLVRRFSRADNGRVPMEDVVVIPRPRAARRGGVLLEILQEPKKRFGEEEVSGVSGDHRTSGREKKQKGRSIEQDLERRGNEGLATETAQRDARSDPSRENRRSFSHESGFIDAVRESDGQSPLQATQREIAFFFRLFLSPFASQRG